ncbi:hypothetical protein V6N13_107845 [Hibiscus sabdariffa]|uniref:Uncharacterized protein n=1 Tax=Hibiscus sabdariffa TaxID=183260 RepID=A0ABR2SQT5_9ROSI
MIAPSTMLGYFQNDSFIMQYLKFYVNIQRKQGDQRPKTTGSPEGMSTLIGTHVIEELSRPCLTRKLDNLQTKPPDFLVCNVLLPTYLLLRI